MSSVVLENVCKVFGGPPSEGIRALNDLSLRIEQGELIVLVGPSGSGKTTLLRLIAGLEEPSAGTVSIDGELVNYRSAEKRQAAMVFQEHALYPHMTAYQNLAFGLKLRKMPRGEIERRVHEAADLLGLMGLLGRQPSELSGGECQRVALGRAMVLKPRVFLLDEPLSNLDAGLRAQMRHEIAHIQRRLGATMVYVTHDQAEAMALADRLVVLDHGVIQQVGRSREIYARPANRFVASFIGAPPMNFVSGTIVRHGPSVLFRSLETGAELPDGWTVEGPKHWGTKAAAGDAVVLGFRPEHVRLVAGAPEAGANGCSFDAEAEACEPLGWETHLYLKAGGCRFVLRGGPNCRVNPGQRLHVALDTNRTLLFDGKTGKRLSDPADEA
jgi:multiple sugar transport system ATP-binding protein